MPQQTDQEIKDAITAARTNANDLVQWEAELKPILDNIVDSKPNNTDLTAGLATKANTSHTHAISDVTGLQTALDSKAASSHTHAIANVTGLQTALDGKQATLVSGTNIKTINGTPVLGSGDITVGGGGAETKQTLTDGATITWDFAAGKNAQVTLGGNRTLAFANDADQDIAILKVIQDATGSRQLALPVNCRVVNDGAGLVTLSTDPDAQDILSFYKDGSDFYVNVSRNFTKPTVYDSDAQAYFAAAGITDTTQKDAWNAFVVSAKAKGYWSKFQAIYPFIGGTAAAHKFNAKNPLDTDGAFRLTYSGSVTHDAAGLTGGTGKYADTKFNPNTNFTSTNFSLGYFVSGSQSLDGNYAMGCYSGSPNKVVGFKPVNGSSFTNCYAGDFANDIVSGSPLGFIAVTRNSLTEMFVSRNGSYTSKSNSFVGFPNFNMYIGGLNEAGGTVTSFTALTFQFVFMGAHLTSTNMLDLYSDVAALQTALGR